MQRDFILVVGNQGCGKTVWTKAYCSSEKRLFVFDPVASFPGVDFLAHPDDWLHSVVNKEREQFRFGTHHTEELPMFGNAAFAAGDCTMAIDECALVFRRGEECPQWAKPLIFMGRHQRVNLILSSQRITKIPIDIRSQASRIVTFRQTEPDDVTALTDQIGKQYKSVIPSLPDLTCLDWEPGRTADPVKIYPIKY